MTTENNSEQKISESKTADNKTIFGPLGKYAVIAVIMVSIIVTTAVMLDKQLNSVDEKLAVIENEVAEMNAYATERLPKTRVTETSVDADSSEAETVVTEANASATEVAETELVAEVAAIEETTAPATTETQAQARNQQTPAAEVLVAQQPAATASFEMVSIAPSSEARRAQFEMENQARIDAIKKEQKQYMAELFARIKMLETQQLDKYKASQAQHVSFLREQIQRQQQVIETLIARNKESLEMREASVLKSQTNREQVLNRI